MAKKTPIYDVTKHVLVPKHTKLNDKETTVLLETYTITARELPKILITDPAIGHLDVKEGDVIKIVREDAVRGESIFFRRVTSG